MIAHRSGINRKRNELSVNYYKRAKSGKRSPRLYICIEILVFRIMQGGQQEPDSYVNLVCSLCRPGEQRHYPAIFIYYLVNKNFI